MGAATAVLPMEAGLTLAPAGVLLYPARGPLPDHETVVHLDIARRIADLLDLPFEGTFDPGIHGGKPYYFVPSGTIVGPELKQRLGLHDEMSLFGGYCEHAFMPTKAISHGLVDASSAHPPGWSHEFETLSREAVLPGYTAFSLEDFLVAGKRLLRDGPLRVKPVEATAGRGQIVVPDLHELNRAADTLDRDRLSRCGVVLERHLDEVITYSVGQVRFPGLTASYIGTQSLTQDNDGIEVYGGSTLQFARGDYEALLALPLPQDYRAAVKLAQVYDRAAGICYPSFFASRRNYDVAAGYDQRGNRHVGVLEQSWRIGGASRAEIAALEVMHADPACQQLKAATLELYGTSAVPPAHAIETFSGQDPDLGLIRKYVMVEAYGYT